MGLFFNVHFYPLAMREKPPAIKDYTHCHLLAKKWFFLNTASLSLIVFISVRLEAEGQLQCISKKTSTASGYLFPLSRL